MHGWQKTDKARFDCARRKLIAAPAFVVAGSRFGADEKSSARIADGARMKTHPRAIGDLE
jgi:hypothetical protein